MPAVVALLISMAWLATLIVPSEEAVKVRNALILDVGVLADFSWTPEASPPGFKRDPGPATTPFVQTARTVLSRAGVSASQGLEAGRAIASHLMGAGTFVGNPIQADNATALREITVAGRGYCADFTQVFNAISIAATLPVREWSLSFGGFGAGHAFNEVWDASRGQWVLLDSFHSLYFVDSATHAPLSVVEVHDRLLGAEASSTLEIVRIVPARFPFRSDAAALDYYRRGMRELALVWGVNPFEYEASAAVRLTGRVSRSLAQVTAIALGVYPRARIFPTGVNQRDVRELERTRQHFCMALVAVGVSSLLVLWPLFRRQAPRRPLTG